LGERSVLPAGAKKIFARACGPMLGSSSGAGVIRTTRTATAAMTPIIAMQDGGKRFINAMPHGVVDIDCQERVEVARNQRFSEGTDI